MTEQPPSVRNFGRDIAINVAANLIAAAILYLLAVLGDYIVAKPFLVTVAVLILASAASTSAAMFRRDWVLTAVVVVISVVLITMVISDPPRAAGQP